jgi:hypothetical protein
MTQKTDKQIIEELQHKEIVYIAWIIVLIIIIFSLGLSIFLLGVLR